MISINSDALLNYYQLRAGIVSGASSSGSSSSGPSPKPPAAPWNAPKASKAPSLLANRALNGQNVINPHTALTDVKGAGAQYDSLFTLYQGLNALSGLTNLLLSSSGKASGDTRAAAAFKVGLSQVTSYVNGLSLPNIRITNGTVSTSASTTLAPAVEKDSYKTNVIFIGGMNDAVPAFQGTVQFNINITKINGAPIVVPIDLSQMGSTTRSMPNVVSYINSQLAAAGVLTRFATNDQPAAPQTVRIGSQTVTLPPGPDSWSFKINGDSSEKASFSAPSNAAAVYVAQTSGNPQGTGATGVTGSAALAAPVQQLIKLQTTNSTTGAPPPAALALPGTANSVPGEALATTLGPKVGAIHATATGPNGSVYVVADIAGTVNGYTLQGAQNAALLKYDSTGQLQSVRTLGATGSTSGYSIAVSAGGSVAVAGSVTGSLTPQASAGATSSASSAPATQSFVSVFNPAGDLQWTQQSAAVGANQANGVAFDASGSVYVVGQVTGALPGGQSVSGQDGYLQGYSAAGVKLFTTQFGAAGTNAATSLAVSGSSVVVGGVESGHGVLRSFTLNASGPPTAGATRDLGSLQGGSISGVAINGANVVVAGTTANTALAAGAVTRAFSGTQDAFVAQLSSNLVSSASDAVAYYGGAGSTTGTALTVANGQVYIAGSSTGGLPGLADQGPKEGYVANINVATGAVQWSQSLKGQDGYDAPKSIAVDATGASVLDRLGLPTGTLQYTSSQLLTSATSVRAGDQFKIRTAAGAAGATVTIAADETSASLATKISRATGSQVNVSVVTVDGKQEVKITSRNPRQTIELLPGSSGADALAPLGLTAGVVQTGPAIAAASKASHSASAHKVVPTDTYGLNLDQAFDLTTTAGVKATQAAIQLAMAKVQAAYYNLNNGNQPKVSSAPVGTVPAYLKAQIANYNAALTRLTGG